MKFLSSFKEGAKIILLFNLQMLFKKISEKPIATKNPDFTNQEGKSTTCFLNVNEKLEKFSTNQNPSPNPHVKHHFKSRLAFKAAANVQSF